LQDRQSDAAGLPIKRSDKRENTYAFIFVCRQFALFSVNLWRKWELQMALIARLQHPYIVEFKEAWVEKVCSLGTCTHVYFSFGFILFQLNA
jgi:hypothetical protein